MNRTKIAIVTGATSLIGKNLIANLLDKGYKIYSIVRDIEKAEKDNNIIKTNMIKCDLNELDTLLNKITDKCDVFFHLAWNGTRGKDRLDEEMQSQNYLYSIQILKIARAIGCQCFVGAGSQAEYGINNGLIDEETECCPNTAYGKYKLKFTLDGLRYAMKNKIQFIMPRFFSLYGADDYANTIIQSTIVNMIHGKTCDFTKCTQNWNFMYIDDAVSAMIHLYENNFSGIYNFATQDTRMLKDFILQMAEITKTKSILNFGAKDYPPEGAVSLNPDINKLASTGFKSKITFESGIRKVLDSLKNK